MRKTYLKPSMRNYRMKTPQLLEGSNNIPVKPGQPDEWGARGDGVCFNYDDFDDEE